MEEGKDRGSILMSFIDAYAEERESHRLYFLKTRKNKPIDENIQASLNILIDTMTKKDKTIDPHYFIDDLVSWRNTGIFYSNAQAEDVRNGLDAYNIEVPGELKPAFTEIKLRSGVLQSFGVNWSEDKVKVYTGQIEKEVKAYSHDVKSKVEYLSKIHSIKVDEIKEQEKKVLNSCGYSFSRLFDDLEGLSDKEIKRDINHYYFNAHCEGISFLDAHRLLSHYTDKRNELRVIQGLLSCKPKTVKSLIDLTTFELARRHLYLSDAKVEGEHILTSKEAGDKYGHYKSAKNIEMDINDIKMKRREAKIKELQNIHITLQGYPDIQKKVLNDIDRLK